MIDQEFVSTMARYNQWQNNNLYEAANGLGNEERKRHRGAFFGSIHETLCHVLWGDMIWTSRFAGLDSPSVSSISGSEKMIESWVELSSARTRKDIEIINWAEQLPKGDIEGDLSWFSGSIQADVTRPLWEILVHFFNHQTHHRGQVHAMITAAGGKPDDTDLFIMSKTE